MGKATAARTTGRKGSGPSREYRVYVIELNRPRKRTGDPDKPWLYVGQTAKTPEERIEQHRRGARHASGRRLASTTAHKYFHRGRPDLYEHIEPVHDRAAAEELEKRVAEGLRAQGYSVHCG